MVLLAKEEKGWNFSSTRNRTAAESEIRRRGVLGCVCAERGRRAGQEGAVKCGSAGGARNWRGGAAEMADGGGQRSSGEVVERGKEQECRCAQGDRRKEKFIGRVLKLKRGARAGTKQLLAVDGARGGSGGRRPTRPREEELAGSVERRAGELGARWRRKNGKGAAGGWGKTPVIGVGRRCRETERGK
jgi:hypothetical protein